MGYRRGPDMVYGQKKERGGMGWAKANLVAKTKPPILAFVNFVEGRVASSQFAVK